MIGRRFALRALAAAALMASVGLSPERAEASDAARDLVMSAAERLIGLIRSDQAQAEKEVAFRALMEETAAMSAIARTALGAPWRSMTDPQKARYDQAFRTYLARNYVARFRDYTGETLDYVKTTENDKGVYVETAVRSAGAQPFKVVWRLKELGGALKVVDIKAADLSLLATERSILNSLLEKNGGDFDSFIAALESGARG